MNNKIKNHLKDKIMCFNNRPSLNASLFVISLISTCIIGSIFFVNQLTTNENNITLKYIQDSIVYAQMNSKQGSSTTIIGDTFIPYATSNDTKTTVVSNATNSNVTTSIDRSAIAQNSTAANNFAKEPPTSPISPTGISTEGLQQPPGHRIINNNEIPMGK